MLTYVHRIYPKGPRLFEIKAAPLILSSALPLARPFRKTGFPLPVFGMWWACARFAFPVSNKVRAYYSGKYGTPFGPYRPVLFLSVSPIENRSA